MLLDDVMGDVFAEHLHLGIIVVVVGVADFDLGDQLLRRGMLDVGLVEQVGIDAGAALVRFMAGDADLARDVAEDRVDDVAVAFFADFLADFFAVAAFARFDFA